MSDTASSCNIRALQSGDHAAVLAIYNDYVAYSTCTFDTTPFSLAARIPWFAQFQHPRRRCIVAHQADKLLGYACCVPLKDKPAYGRSVEVSIYTAREHQAQGVGSALYDHLFHDLETKTDLHRAYACITLPNDPSIALHEKFGFTHVGHFNEAGFKFGQYWDVAWYERALI